MMNPEGALLVGISNPDTAARLVGLSASLSRTSIQLPAPGAQPVLLVHAVTVANQINLGIGSSSPEVIRARDLLQAAGEAARNRGQRVRAIVEVARSVEAGLLSAAESHNASLILVGYSGDPVRSEAEERFDRTMHRVARKARADVVIATFRRREHHSILVPVPEDAPLRLTSRLCRALEADTGAIPTFLHVAPRDASAGEARERVQARLASVFRGGEPQLRVVTSDDPQVAIMEESEGHDLVLLGPSRRPGLLDAVFSNRTRRIAESVSSSVVIGWGLAEED
ncbi:MAG: universal stress protein [Gemmatimonadetes bacterium]|nr:universal stress protein [Gemmatimonadota bacterium]NNF11829.1 universal stress protein [Gemmatimonadota bacterium]